MQKVFFYFLCFFTQGKFCVDCQCCLCNKFPLEYQIIVVVLKSRLGLKSKQGIEEHNVSMLFIGVDEAWVCAIVTQISEAVWRHNYTVRIICMSRDRP